MTDDNKSAANSSSNSWIGLLAALAAAAVLFGLRGNADVEVFGLELSPLLVALVVWVLGFVGGAFGRRRR